MAVTCHSAGMKTQGRLSARRPARAGIARSRPHIGGLAASEAGAVLVEVALSLPILIILMIGIISYGAWLTAANAVQQAANEAARAALGGLSATERQSLAAESVTRSLSGNGVLDPSLVTISTSQTGSFYSVAVTYDASRSRLFSASPVPLPKGQIRRASVVKLVSL